MDAQLVLGVDSSTQSVKAELRRLDDGILEAMGRIRHPSTSPPRSEQHPEAWWQALKQACAQLGDARQRVVAVAVAGQQHGLVLLDDEGAPLRAAPLWNDTTAAPPRRHIPARAGNTSWNGTPSLSGNMVRSDSWRVKTSSRAAPSRAAIPSRFCMRAGSS